MYIYIHIYIYDCLIINSPYLCLVMIVYAVHENKMMLYVDLVRP